jgi:hypothetical protein
LAANRGSLDIFTRDPVTGSWTRRTATLGAADFSEPPTSGPGANGFPVAMSGNTIVTTPARVHIFDVPPPPQPVSVTVTTTPPGHLVSITGTGCQAGTYNQTQTLNLLPGTLCTLSIPAQTLTFLGWENSTKNATRPIEIPFAPYTYVAHFGAKFGISISPAGAGTVSGPTIQTCTGSCIVPVDAAPSNTLTAAAGGLYTFAGWGGDCSSFGTNPSCTLPSDSGDKFIIANFTTPPTTLTAAVGLKSGIVNGLRTWPIVFTNKGPGPALDIYVLSFAVDQAVPLGTLPTCFPKMVTGPNVPPGTSIVPAGGTLVFPATIDFTGCKSTDRFHLLMYYGWGNIPIAQKLELWNQLQ